MAQTAKSGKKSGTFAKGGDPRQGRGPKKGAPNAGRPRDADKEWLASILSSDECRDKAKAVLTGTVGDDRLFWRAFSEAWDKLNSKPSQSVEISGEIELVPRPPSYTVDEWAKLCAGARN